ncbi:MAG: hypothetical protein ABW167_05115 [Baekduia sp.]
MTLRLRLRIATALALLLALTVPALAHASTQALFKDCADGSLDSRYSQKDYAQALANLPADLDEYSDCRSQIQRAQLGGGKSSNGGGGTGSGGGGGITTGPGGPTDGGAGAAGTAPPSAVNPLDTATPAERASFRKAITAGDAPVEVDGRPIDPGALGGAKSNGIADLPTPLLAILALLAIGGLSAAGFGTRRLVHSRRPA